MARWNLSLPALSAFAAVCMMTLSGAARALGQAAGVPSDPGSPRTGPSSVGWRDRSSPVWPASEPADRIMGPIEASQRVTTNGVHPLATRQNDQGRVSSAQMFHRMILLLQGSDAQEEALRQLIQAQQDPNSSQYHHWLTPAEFGRRFGPSQNDLAKLTAWLNQQGFTVEPAPAAGAT